MTTIFTVIFVAQFKATFLIFPSLYYVSMCVFGSLYVMFVTVLSVCTCLSVITKCDSWAKTIWDLWSPCGVPVVCLIEMSCVWNGSRDECWLRGIIYTWHVAYDVYQWKQMATVFCSYVLWIFYILFSSCYLTKIISTTWSPGHFQANLTKVFIIHISLLLVIQH
jgi:hypothetical protein